MRGERGGFFITVIPLDTRLKSPPRQYRHDLRENQFAFVHEPRLDQEFIRTPNPNFKSMQVDFSGNLL
ncbi:MAG: hypothetical protein FWH27_08090 [Planctomycetaceae bacterium]|nr:hypothetical protein [Planctomycetaceae bacterium]